MIIMHLILWAGAIAALILSIGVTRGPRPDAPDDLGPGDIDSGHYLASGRIAWASTKSARSA